MRLVSKTWNSTSEHSESIIIFIVLENVVFEDLEGGMGFSLFAEGGAMRRRGTNLEFIVKRLQGAIFKVEKWSYKWEFKFLVDKIKIKLKLYRLELKKVKQFKFFGLKFNE